MSETMKLTDDTRVIAEAARCAIAAAEHLIEVLKEEKRKEEVRQEEEEKEKKAPPPPPARGRARVSDAVLKKWKIEPLFVQYWSEEIDNDSIKDPDKHIKNCWTHRGSDKSWQEYKRLHPAKVQQQTKAWRHEDWQLCREWGCVHCGDVIGCTGGYATPPNKDPVWPHRPDECKRYRTEAAK